MLKYISKERYFFVNIFTLSQSSLSFVLDINCASLRGSSVHSKFNVMLIGRLVKTERVKSLCLGILPVTIDIKKSNTKI